MSVAVWSRMAVVVAVVVGSVVAQHTRAELHPIPAPRRSLWAELGNARRDDLPHASQHRAWAEGQHRHTYEQARHQDTYTPRHHTTTTPRRRDHHQAGRRTHVNFQRRARLPVTRGSGPLKSPRHHHTSQPHVTLHNSIPDHNQHRNQYQKRWQKAQQRGSSSTSSRKQRPNIVLFMTDDQDVELGSLNYMPYLMEHLKNEGAYFPNAYCSTPICCPSRSSLLTGLYIHNHEVYTNNRNCSSYRWQQTHEKRSFATFLANVGYRTGYFGKYLNKYNGSHIPAGWHEFAGLIKNSRYYNYTVMRNGNFVKYGDQYPKDYYPHVITNEGIQFLRKSRGSSQPMMLVLSYPAPHGPEDSAPEHSHQFFNATDHNTLSYNYAPNPDKQWLLQFTGRMQDIEVKFTDILMTKRLQTLQTVDESVAKVVNELRHLGELDNTYIFYTSDHGYHLGQFGLVKGKSMPFEFDIKVPFLVRGPGIKPGIEINNIALNIDLAPTFLDIAGVSPPAFMDGRSLLPVLTSIWNDSQDALIWRDSFLVESSGRHREEDALELREVRRRQRAQGLAASEIKGALYTSKREMVEIICQGDEYKSPCSPGQKWECVYEINRWRLHKCRKKTKGPKMKWRRRNCVCEPDMGMGYLVRLNPAERRKQRTFLKKYLTQDLRRYNTKFIKVFSDVDSHEMMEQSLHIPSRQVLLQSKLHNNSRNRRNAEQNKKVNKEEEEEQTHTEEDIVDAFVKDEEIRDLEVTIDTLSDELESLESNIAATVASANNTTISPLESHETTQQECQGTSTTVGYTEEVYRDSHAWRLSKFAIDQQIRRLKHQLIVMKDIRKHLRDTRPDSFKEYDYDDEEVVEDSPMADLGHIASTLVTVANGTRVEKEDRGVEDSTTIQGSEETHMWVEKSGKGEFGSARPLPHHINNFKVFPDRSVPRRRQIVSVLENETLAQGQCWCNRNFRLKQKQVERERKRQERQKLRQERQWIKQKRREMKEKKKMRKIKNNLAQCNYTMLNCYTHDNDHWRTPPLWHGGKFCFCMNAINNTYWCVRTINQTHNFLYCEFITGLVTYYDLKIDPYQLRNVAFMLSNKRLAGLHRRLEALRTCAGAAHCDDLPQPLQNGRSVAGMEVHWKPQEVVKKDYDQVKNTVEVEEDFPHISIRGKEKEERRRQREERQRHREERRRHRKQYKKLKRYHLQALRSDSVLQSSGSNKNIIRLPRKSRTHGRRRDKKRWREERRERKRRKKGRRVRIMI